MSSSSQLQRPFQNATVTYFCYGCEARLAQTEVIEIPATAELECSKCHTRCLEQLEATVTAAPPPPPPTATTTTTIPATPGPAPVGNALPHTQMHTIPPTSGSRPVPGGNMSPLDMLFGATLQQILTPDTPAGMIQIQLIESGPGGVGVGHLSGLRAILGGGLGGDVAMGDADFQRILDHLFQNAMNGHHQGPPPLTKQQIQQLSHVKCTDEMERNRMDCVICQDVWAQGADLIKLPGCNHYFCTECVGPWLERSSTCPTCRARVTVNADEQPQPH